MKYLRFEWMTKVEIHSFFLIYYKLIMNFGNLNKMQNTQLNEDNEEGRAISEYDEYLKKIAKNDFPSTKSKDCPVKIPNECKLIKKDETGYNDGAKIIKTKDINTNVIKAAFIFIL